MRFGFDGRRISQIQRQIKNKATGTPHGVYDYILPSLASDDFFVYSQESCLYMYTGVGLSALLVSICRAMREPFYRGTSDRTGSTLLCVYANRMLNCPARESAGTLFTTMV